MQCADILASAAVVGAAEQRLLEIFDEAERRAGAGGALVILDDVHLLCPRRGAPAAGGAAAVPLAGTLLALLDGVGPSRAAGREGGRAAPRGGLAVLALTTDPAVLDPALRRPGRLDVEVEVPVPDARARAEILTFHLARCLTPPPLAELDVPALARLAKGFTGADVALAVKEAVRTALSRTPASGGLERGEGSPGLPASLVVLHQADLEHAIRITKPSAIQSVAVEVPTVMWSSIGGMDSVKASLKESIELPLTHPHLFELLQVPPPKGILLYGPPGCSKTLMVRVCGACVQQCARSSLLAPNRCCSRCCAGFNKHICILG